MSSNKNKNKKENETKRKKNIYILANGWVCVIFCICFVFFLYHFNVCALVKLFISLLYCIHALHIDQNHHIKCEIIYLLFVTKNCCHRISDRIFIHDKKKKKNEEVNERTNERSPHNLTTTNSCYLSYNTQYYPPSFIVFSASLKIEFISSFWFESTNINMIKSSCLFHNH